MRHDSSNRRWSRRWFFLWQLVASPFDSAVKSAVEAGDAPGWKAARQNGSSTRSYSKVPVQVSSDLCAPLPEGIETWPTSLPTLAHEPASTTSNTAGGSFSSAGSWKRGDRNVCPKDEACWLLSSAASHDRGTSGGGRDATHTVTLFFSISARPTDGSWPLMAFESLSTTRRTLGLTHAPAVLIFDGLTCKPGISAPVVAAYDAKIKQLARSLHREGRVRGSAYTMIVYEFWLFKAEALRRALELVPPTPLVFVSEEDRAVEGAVDAHLITRMLLSADTAVQTV